MRPLISEGKKLLAGDRTRGNDAVIGRKMYRKLKQMSCYSVPAKPKKLPRVVPSHSPVTLIYVARRPSEMPKGISRNGDKTCCLSSSSSGFRRIARERFHSRRCAKHRVGCAAESVQPQAAPAERIHAGSGKPDCIMMQGARALSDAPVSCCVLTHGQQILVPASD